jgi:hypothetical protein
MPSCGRENRRRAGRVPGLAGSQSKGGRAGRVVATILVALAGALAVSGCETNAERSAKLEKERLAHPVAVQKGLVVTRESPHVKVVEAVAVHDENGTAVVAILRNTSTGALRDAPIAITVSDAGGATLYQNNAPGLDPTLVSAPLLEPGREAVWVDDQIPTTATAPAKVSARVGEPPGASARAGEPPGASGRPGEGPNSSAAVPQLSVRGVHLFEDPSNGVGEEGTVLNASKVTQQKLVVYAVGRRSGRIVAAGRAVLPEVPAGHTTPFQVFFIGDPRGTQLQVSAPASTL